MDASQHPQDLELEMDTASTLSAISPISALASPVSVTPEDIQSIQSIQSIPNNDDAYPMAPLVPLACAQCDRTFASARGLAIHVRSHDQPAEQVNCPFCQREFTRAVHLNRHVDHCPARAVVEKEREQFRLRVLELQTQFQSLVDRVLNL